MTKYILHGGNTSDTTNIDNQNFYKEITLDEKKSTNILLVYFASKEGEWKSHEEQDTSMINQMKDLELETTIEIARLDNLKEQVQWADVIYFRGGQTELLLEGLLTLDNWKDLVKDKTIAASSAGTILSHYVYFPGRALPVKGLGVIGLKVICHYTPDLKAYVEMLKNINGPLPILCLPNHKYQVFFN